LILQSRLYVEQAQDYSIDLLQSTSTSGKVSL